MKRESIWKEVCEKRSVTPSIEDLSVDVLIIGAGLAGLSTAYELLNSKKRVAIIEKGCVGEGITSCSTGKLDFMQGLVYQKIAAVSGEAVAKKYYEAQKDAISLARKIINENHIACDLTDTDGYVFTNEEKELPTFEKEKSLYQKWNVPYEEISKLPNGYPCLYGLKTTGSAVFHPVKYLLSLKKIVENTFKIYENVCATEIKKSYGKYKVTTNHGIIWAKKVVVCTHYPFFIIPGYIPFRTHIEKSYLLAASLAQVYPIHAITSSKPIVSMRYYKNDIFLMATNSHTTTDQDNDALHFANLEKNYHAHFNGEIQYMWSTHDIMTSDHIPFIGAIGPNLFIATGFNKWGMTNGILSGKILCDLVLNRKNKYSDLFRINRGISPKKVVNLVVSNLETGKTFIGMKLDKNKKFYTDVEVKKEKGKAVGIYKENGKEYKVYNTCPHMGCSLLFNEEEKTWDCPCHGSRFTKEGEIVNGPSVYSIKIK